MNRWIQSVLILGVLGFTAGCEMADRVRGSAAGDTAVAQSGGITLNLESPGMVRAGEETVFRLNVWNRGDTAIAQLRAELLLPTWMEPLPPEPAGTSVTMVSSGEGTHLSYAVAEPPLQAGETRTVVQRVRTPTLDTSGAEVSPSRTIRAWLVGPGGQPLGIEVTSDIAVEGARGAAGGDAAAALGDPRGNPTVDSASVGPLRLGMTAAEVRQQAPQARDTTWTVEGNTERGMVVPPDRGGAGGAVVARLQNQRVDQIRIRDRQTRTAEGLGVGSRLEELRSAYGQACADTGERGEVVVWFARKPGVSFVLDARPPANPDAIRRDPSQLAGSATVRELIVRRGAGGC